MDNRHIRGGMVTPIVGASEADIENAINMFTPQREVRSWDTIAEFVRTSVRRAQPFNVRKAREFCMIGARHVDFCVLNNGFTLDWGLWDPDLAEAFIATWGSERALRTVAVARSQLQDLVRRVGTTPGLEPSRRTRYRSRPNAPYTKQQVAGLHAWANTRRVRRARRTAHAILALGLGLGLTGTTMTKVCGKDFIDHGEDGIEFAFEGRSSWCDAAFDDDLRSVLQQRPASAPLIELTGETTLATFLAASRKASRPLDALVPETDRLRATWFAYRSTHFSALVAVMDAYGIRHTSTLQSVIAQLPQPTSDQIRTALRTKGTL